jgi:hypothetical protein
MKPNWFRCDKCLFGLEVDTDGIIEIECNHSPSVSIIKPPADFCKEWICANCWCGWDTCTYPRDEDDYRGIYDDHNICLPVRFKGE